MKKTSFVLCAAVFFIFNFSEIFSKQDSFFDTDDSVKSKKEFAKRTYVATRAQIPPVIDGAADDSCWSKENWHDLNFQKEPVDGGDPTERTYFKIVYDNDNLYAIVRLYDSEPEKISKILSNRDNFTGDIIGLSIDSYFDRRTAFEFDVTAAGAKMDLIVTNGNEMNFNWNPVWDTKIGFEDSAWIAEFKIPFSQLRFSEKEEQTWGFMVWRWIYRKAEENDWGPNPISSSTWVDTYGYLKGIKGIKTPSRIELLPYALGKYHTYKKEENNPYKTGSDKSLDFGLDGKIGLSAGFTLDLTINPDFGQVEADASQISLSSYELEYEEKRPFFIEGNDILSFSDLYYPRRIGHVPSYSPALGINEYADVPDRTSILGAAKITGKTEDGLSIGILESITGKETADISGPAKDYSTAVEPLTNYFVGRIQKELDGGNIIYSGAITAVNRNIEDDQLSFLAKSSYTGGLDFTYKWDDKNYSIYSAAMFSSVHGNVEAITNIQKSPAHYFQRPDADYLNIDTNKTSLNGYGAIVEFKKSGGGNWRFTETVKLFSPNFEINDFGYLPQVDRISQSTSAGYVVQTPSGILRNYSIYFNQSALWNYGGDNYEFKTGFDTYIKFVNRWKIEANLYRIFNSFDPSVIWGGPLFKTDGAWSYELEYESDNTLPFSFGINYENKIHDDNISKYYEFTPYFTYRITDALTFSGTINYSFTRNNLQYISTEQSGGNNYYFLGKVDQHLWGITARVSFNITPDLSIQYYGSPFSVSRKYSEIKRATNLRAENYNDRFYLYSRKEISFNSNNNVYNIDDNADGQTDFVLSNPDMAFNQFRSNLVLRWEYNPGSTIYLVWSQDRDRTTGYESSSFAKTVDRVFNIYPDNIFMIKINHWFSL
jgi:hypothetical protein